ncbi:MAG: TetR/AcrR family transcriptional regulator [Syntrophales bacterium]|jgi:AcrR family transcriptional regulator|nr:TetR/AcrR family transcriptional regulator [Syntrophales bacterium]
MDMLKGCSKVDTEVRRAQITQAALDIIAGDGVKGLTTSAIAGRVGISGANLYRHFQNKNEILNSVVAKIGADLLQNLRAVRGAAPEDPLLKLTRLVRRHLEYTQNNKGIPRLVFSEEMHITNVPLKEKLLRVINSYTQEISSLIREGQDAGIIKQNMEPQALALTIVGLIQVTALKWSLNGFSFSPVDQGMKLWKNLERCITTK